MDLMTFKQFDAEAMVVYDHEASKLLDKDYWCVVNSFKYYVGSPGSDMYVQVPKGYLTDGASVPQVFWNLLPPWIRYGQAAITHDYLCDYGEVILNGEPAQITRKEVDRILAEAMQVLGVKPWKRFIISNAVGDDEYKKYLVPHKFYHNAYLGTSYFVESDKQVVKF